MKVLSPHSGMKLHRKQHISQYMDNRSGRGAGMEERESQLQPLSMKLSHQEKTAVRGAWREKECGFCWTSFTNLQLNLQQNLFIFFLPNIRNRKNEEKNHLVDGQMEERVHTYTRTENEKF